MGNGGVRAHGMERVAEKSWARVWVASLCQGRTELGQSHHRHLSPPRMEKVVLGRSHGVTVKGLTKETRT